MADTIDKKDIPVNNPGSGNYFKNMGYYNINDIVIAHVFKIVT